jgi:hypothetical protein
MWTNRAAHRASFYATSRKVAGSIPDEGIGFISWPNPSVVLLYCSILLRCIDPTLPFAFMPSVCNVSYYSRVVFCFIDTAYCGLTGHEQLYKLWLMNLLLTVKLFIVYLAWLPRITSGYVG